MKVLYSHYHTDGGHPAVQMINQISRNLADFGHEIHVHASAGMQLDSTKSKSKAESEPESKSSGKRSGSVLSRLKRKLWFAKAMARNRKWFPRDIAAIQKVRPELMIIRQDAYCWSATRAAMKLGIPFITYADAPVAYETRMFNGEKRWHPPGLVERIERWGLEAGNAVITVSHPAARRLQTYRLRTPIHVIHNGVDHRKFEGITPDERAAIRRELGLENRTVIGFQGTFKAFHGMERLKDLMVWSARFPEVTWLLIGDGPERETIETAVKDQVPTRFLGRRLPEEMGRLLSAMDIAVAPHSRMKGDFYFCPLKILEYAAAGCATIASNQGDIPLLLADGRGGEIVDDDRLESWIRALEKLILDTGLRTEIAHAGRTHVLQNLTWRETARQVEQVMHRVLNLPAPIRIQPVEDRAPTTEGRCMANVW